MARQRQKARDRKRRAQQGADAELTPHGNEDGQPINVSGEVDEFASAVAHGGETDGTSVDEVAASSGLGGDEADTGDSGGSGIILPGSASRAEPPEGPKKRGAPRAIQFLGACWAELQRVQWPDRRQVAQATGVVVGFVIIAGAYLGAADYVAKQVVDWII